MVYIFFLPGSPFKPGIPLKPGSPFSPFSPWRPGLPKERKKTCVSMWDIWYNFYFNFSLQFLFYKSINTCLEILPCQEILWDLGHPAFQEFLHCPFHPYLQINLDYPFFLVLPRRSSTQNPHINSETVFSVCSGICHPSYPSDF